MKKTISIVLLVLATMLMMTGCDIPESDADRQRQVANQLEKSQQTPTDIDYSLERYNLIRRAYWVNGQREKALSLECPVQKPLGYIVLLTDNGAILGNFIVDGKVTSLNSFLTPDSEFVGSGKVLADVDGSYGENDAGIFFFTPDGKYLEWTGTYLYSDIPFEVEQPILKINSSNN